MQQLELRAVLRREQRCALRRPVCVPGEIGGCHEALPSCLHAVSAFTCCFQFSAGITSAIPASDRRREPGIAGACIGTVSYTHLRAHETPAHLVCRLLLEKKKT